MRGQTRARTLTAADLRDLHLQRGPRALAGRVLGPYTVLEELSRGGMGAVFKARRGQSTVALKVMLPAGSSETKVERFQREARILARFRHPGIVRVLDFGESKGLLYYAMELLKGKDLQNLTTAAPQSRRLKYEAAIALMGPMAEALEYCHDKGVIHRDVKPSNIVITARGQPVLIDFGLVKADPDRTREILASLANHRALSVTGQLIGTPAFMAPEQLEPGGAFGPVEPRTDVWGLGSTLFFAVSGRLPYEESGHIQHFAALMARDPMRLRDVDPEAPELLDDFCCWLLQREAARRPSMSEVARELNQRLANYRPRFPDSARARRNRAKPRPDSSDAERPPIPPPAPPRRKRQGKGMSAVYIFFALAACLSASSLYWLTRPTLPPAKRPPVSFEKLEAEAKFTREDRVVIRAKTNREVVRFYIGDENWLINDGVFKQEVELRPGLNRIEVRVTTFDGTEARQSLEVFQDKLRPDFEFEGGDTNSIRLDDDSFLIGKVRDRSPVELTVGGLPVEIKADKSFVMPTKDLDLEKPLSVKAVDAAGNSRERVYKVSTAKARAEKKKVREWRERIARRKREILRTVKTARECYLLGFKFANSVEQRFEAIAHFTAALELNPSMIDAYFYRGLSQVDHPINDTLRVEEDYQALLKLVPQMANPYYLKARWEYQYGSLEEAERLFRLAVQLLDDVYDRKHNDKYSCYALSFAFLSQIYERRGDLDSAIRLYTNSMTLNMKPPPGYPENYYGDHSRFYLNRARLYVKASRPSEALDDVNSCLKMNPKNLQGRIDRARILRDLRLYDQAVREYEYVIPRSVEGKKLKAELRAMLAERR